MAGSVAQQGRQGIGGDALNAREARAVVQHRRAVAQAQGAPPPLGDNLAGALKAGGQHRLWPFARAYFAQVGAEATQGQEDLLRHDVVAPLVHVGDDARQRQRR